MPSNTEPAVSATGNIPTAIIARILKVLTIQPPVPRQVFVVG
jgi:hypothetical protein